MKLEGTIHCDGPECERHAHVNVDAMAEGRLCIHFVKLTEYGDAMDREWAFCGYDCLMKWAAQFPPPEIIPMHPSEDV